MSGRRCSASQAFNHEGSDGGQNRKSPLAARKKMQQTRTLPRIEHFQASPKEAIEELLKSMRFCTFPRAQRSAKLETTRMNSIALYRALWKCSFVILLGKIFTSIR